jgi:hypothetical protein
LSLLCRSDVPDGAPSQVKFANDGLERDVVALRTTKHELVGLRDRRGSEPVDVGEPTPLG